MDHKRNLSIKVLKNIVFNKTAFALLEGLLLWVKALVVLFGEQYLMLQGHSFPSGLNSPYIFNMTVLSCNVLPTKSINVIMLCVLFLMLLCGLVGSVTSILNILWPLSMYVSLSAASYDLGNPQAFPEG
jgi:hypothetical protein